MTLGHLYTWIILFTLFSRLVFAEVSLNKCFDLDWTKEDTRTQAGGWNWYPGKGKASSLEEAYFFAEGLALRRLIQECQRIPSNVKFHERCDYSNGSIFSANVRASVQEKDCNEAKSNKKHFQFNEVLTKQVENYTSKLREIEKKISNNVAKSMETFEFEWNKGDQKSATHILEKECKAGKYESCFEIGYLFHIKGNYEKAENYYIPACKKNPIACHNLGMIKEIQKDNKNAVMLYERSCLANFQESCHMLGRHYARNKNSIASDAYFDRACKKDYLKSCVSKGRSFLKSGSILQAKELFKKSCEEKEYSGCLELGVLEADKNIDKAREFLNSACDGGASKACTFLAGFEDKHGNKKLARSIMNQTCDRGEALGCYGVFYFNVEDKKDEDALKFLERSFSLGLDPNALSGISKEPGFQHIELLPNYKKIMEKYIKN